MKNRCAVSRLKPLHPSSEGSGLTTGSCWGTCPGMLVKDRVFTHHLLNFTFNVTKWGSSLKTHWTLKWKLCVCVCVCVCVCKERISSQICTNLHMPVHTPPHMPITKSGPQPWPGRGQLSQKTIIWITSKPLWLSCLAIFSPQEVKT